MNTIFFITIILVIAWWTRNLYFRRLITKYRLKLYALREQLRMELITGTIPNNSDIFDFMDYSISKSIQYLDCFNIYILSYLSIKARKNEDFIKFEKEISQKINEDKIISKYYSEFNKITYEFIKKRFVLTKYIFRILIIYVIGSLTIIQIIISSLKNLAIIIKLVPEDKPIPVLLRPLSL